MTEDGNAVIEDGSKVTIEYTLSLEDGTVADSNVGKHPMVFEQGSGKLLPGLERALTGLEADAVKKVTLQPEEGYGVVKPDAYRDVTPETVPEDARQPGTILYANADGGHRVPIRVHEVHDDRIVLDFNHPLAGQTLHFEVKVLAVE